MEVIFGLENIKSNLSSVVTVGTFDGVHFGHQKIISEVVQLAKNEGLISTLVTFDPHPKVVVQIPTKEKIQILTNLNEKLEILADLGLERVVVVKFTREFSELNYRNFVKDILLQKLSANTIIVGYNHAFGRDRVGTFQQLRKLSEKYKFTLKQLGPYEFEGNQISSTRIRQLIKNGEVELAAEMLGNFYAIQGIVVKGEGRGKKLTFPTANIAVDNHLKLLPLEGVYVVDCDIANHNYRGMANIGYKPTFGGMNKTIEVHLLNFSNNIYGEKIVVKFVKHLRKEIKFENESDLINQLKIDRELSSKL
jgi:riboflavin kinase/FMN adenylyltransferase